MLSRILLLLEVVKKNKLTCSRYVSTKENNERTEVRHIVMEYAQSYAAYRIKNILQDRNVRTMCSVQYLHRQQRL